MCNELVIRRFAGTFILLSLALGHWVNPYWLLFTAFVGFNLIQSSLTGFCPLERILGRFGGAGIQRVPRTRPGYRRPVDRRAEAPAGPRRTHPGQEPVREGS